MQPTPDLASIEQLLRQASAQLDASPSARLDAEILFCHVLGIDRSHCHAWPEKNVATEDEQRFLELIQERQQGVPIAYLTGEKEFWSLTLHVKRGVLIPRPETELLVEQALTLIPADKAMHIADLGTGTGAIAIAIASERPHCKVSACDLNSDTLELASSNAKRLGIENIHFIQSDWCSALADNSLDIILSNPPYIAARDPHLSQGDVRFEPETALVSGSDGLDDIRQIVQQCRRILKKDGQLFLEHGYDQENAVQQIFRDNSYSDIATHKDLGGLARVSRGVAIP